VHGLTGVGQSQAEQRACDQLAAQPDRDLTEIDLDLPTGQVLLRNEGVRGFAPGLDADLTPAGGDVLPHHPVRHHPDRVMLVE
jgi:hypothetical protein